MSTKDVWIYALPAEWEALGTEEEPFSYAWSQAVTGFWLPSGPYEVYNVLASLEDVEAIVAALGDVERVFAWDYRGGGNAAPDSLDVYPADPTAILAVMKPHPVHIATEDSEGEITFTRGADIPATFDNPNWGHVFAGVGQRVFASAFSDEFSTEFL